MDKFWRWLLFNVWYYRSPPWDTGISPPELLDFISAHTPGRALDLGCGTGTNVITLAEHGWQVTGVDFARRAVAVARKKARKAGVSADLRVEDVTTLPGIVAPFDLILDIGCYHSLPTEAKTRYATNIARLLSPEGAYLLYAFFKQGGETGTGLLQSDLDALEQRLVLESRKDGTERGIRPSAWFTYRLRKSNDE